MGGRKAASSSLDLNQQTLCPCLCCTPIFKVSDMLFNYILLWTLLKTSVAVDNIKAGDGYNLNYQVDSQSGNVHFSHNENRRGYHTVGSYKTLMPDGRTQVVEPLQIIDVSTNANISIIKPNTHESSYSRISKAKPRLEYNFEPIQDKTTLTKADDTLDTKNKALYQTDFTPKNHRLSLLHKKN